MTLTRILVRYPDRVQIEDIKVSFRKPQNHFRTSRESTTGVEAVFEVPDNPVAKLQAQVFVNYPIKERI